MKGFKRKLVRRACLVLVAAGLPVMGVQAAPLAPCIAFADIGKTWFVDYRSILLKVREADSTKYKVLEFKENLPADLRDRDFRFVRHGFTDTEHLTHVCVNYKVSGLDTAADSGPIAEIIDVDIREATRLVQRAGRLAARQNRSWMNLDRAQSDAFYLWSAQANAPPPGPPSSPPPQQP